MIVSIIGGTGPQGLGIGERLAIEGVDVIIGSRKEEKALEVVEQAKKDLADYDLSTMRGMANEDAAKEGDVLIITVPLAAQKPTVEGIKEFCNDIELQILKYANTDGFSPSVGVVITRDPSISITILYDRALVALSNVKGNYTNHVSFYN